MRFGGAIAAGALTLALAACGGVGSENIEETDPPEGTEESPPADETATEAETEEPDGEPPSGDDSNGNESVAVDVIPDDTSQIDEALVQDVIDTLDPYVERFFANAVAGEFGEEADYELSLVYAEPALGQRLSQITDPEFAALLSDDPGEISSEVQELRTVELECVDAVVVRDMSDVNPATEPGEPWVFTLVPASDTANGTAWQIARELPPEGSSEEARDDGCPDILS